MQDERVGNQGVEQGAPQLSETLQRDPAQPPQRQLPRRPAARLLLNSPPEARSQLEDQRNRISTPKKKCVGGAQRSTPAAAVATCAK
jgi:hypothetical protein